MSTEIFNIIKSIGDAYQEAADYIVKRKEGSAPSLLTPFPSLNEAGVDGIPWQSHFVIGARSGVGKTLIKDQLLRGAFALNADDNIRILDFSFEMPLQATGYRGIQAELKQDKSMLLSTEGNKVDKNTLKRIELIVNNAQNLPVDIVDTQLNVDDIERVIRAVIEKYNTNNDLKLIVSIDHSLLIRRLPNQSAHAAINEYSNMITQLRSKYNIIVFTLSQLNRNIEEPLRKIPGKADNYPQTSDISSADALLTHADFLVILNRPSDFNMKMYGPERYIVPDNKNYVALHLLKNRHGEQRMVHLNANYQNYEFIEMTEPPDTVESGVSRVSKQDFV